MKNRVRPNRNGLVPINLGDKQTLRHTPFVIATSGIHTNFVTEAPTTEGKIDCRYLKRDANEASPIDTRVELEAHKSQGRLYGVIESHPLNHHVSMFNGTQSGP